MKVNLNAVVECIEFEGELLTHYYNKKTDIINFEYKIINNTNHFYNQKENEIAILILNWIKNRF